MLYMLQVYVMKEANTDYVISLFIILLGTYLYVLLYLFCYVCVYPSHVCFK